MTRWVYYLQNYCKEFLNLDWTTDHSCGLHKARYKIPDLILSAFIMTWAEAYHKFIYDYNLFNSIPFSSVSALTCMEY